MNGSSEVQQQLIDTMYLISAMWFIASIAIFMWAYFRWGFK